MALPARARQGTVEPIPWSDAAPLAAPFLQQPFESPAIAEPGQVWLGLRTIYSSSIASTARADLAVDYHLETAQPTLALRLGVLDGLELRAEVPVVTELDPMLDGAILGVESWFNTQNARRRGLSSTADFRVLRPDGRSAVLAGSTTGLGDVRLGLKGRLREQDGWLPALSWRAAVKLPTGRFPFGSGVVEGGAGLLAGLDLGQTHLWAAADLAVPTGGPVSSARLPVRVHPAFQLGIGRQLGRRLTLLLQASTHGAGLGEVHLSDVDGWNFYVLAGARVEASRALSLGVGLVENVIVSERGTDIAGVLDLSYRF